FGSSSRIWESPAPGAAILAFSLEPFPMTEPMNVTHVVLSLDVGGAERNVVNQVREGRALGQNVSIVCLERPGTLAPRVEQMGSQVICLNKRAGLQLSLIGSLRATLGRLRSRIVHSHQAATMFYSAAAVFGTSARLVHTQHGREPFATRRKTRWLGKLGGMR